MFSVRLSTLLATLALAAVAAHAQFPTPNVPPATGLPIHQTFLTSDDGWMPLGEGAKAGPMPNPLSINSVNGALRMEYDIGVGKLGAFMLQVGDGAVTNTKSIRFQIRSDYAAKLVFGLQEKDGGRYVTAFSVPKDKWQTVELTPADFALSDGPTDPKDPDNKLDMDQIQYMGVIDASSLFAQANNDALNAILGVQNGPHTLYMADFQVSAMPLNGASGSPTPPDVLDAFTHPQVGWLLLGGVDAKYVQGDPLPGRGMAVTYKQGPNKLAGLIRSFPTGQITGATKLTFSVASVKAATLIVQVEEKGGGKYNTTIYVPAGATKTSPVSMSFADFKAADDSKDTNGKLDLDQVQHLVIIDASGMKGDVPVETENTLYIGDLRVVR